MTARLSPALALAQLHELSLDVRGAAVLDSSGALLAGDAELAAAARRGDEGVLLARGSHGVSIAVVAGPHALLPLLEHDLATLAEAIDAAGTTGA